MAGLNPSKGNIFLDANTFDYVDHENRLIEILFALQDQQKLNLVISGKVREEVLHPRTPSKIRDLAEVQIFSLRTQLMSTEVGRLEKIKAIMQGNATSGKHDADAQHIFDASKYGGSYLLTHDKRILSKRLELQSLLSPLQIVTLEEFFAALVDFNVYTP